MGLTQLAIKRPLAMLMLIVALVIMGLVSLRLMKVDRLPNITFPFVGVNITYPGASPGDVEKLVAEVAEDGLSGVPGVFSLGSTSSQGRANISLQLAEGADVNAAAIEANQRIGALRARLPADIGTISVNKADPNASPIINIAVTGKRPLDQIYDLADRLVQPRLASVVGVADVQIIGGLQQQVEVAVDYAKLAAYDVTLDQIQTALQRTNVDVPAGSVNRGELNVNIRTVGTFQTPEDLGRLVVASNGAGGEIHLAEVATVTLGYKDITQYQRYNGQDAVGLSITKQSDANTLQVADDVRATLAQIEQGLPEDVHLVVTNDASRFTRNSLEAVQTDLLLAIVLTAAVLLLFLHTWRNVAIVLFAIPTSLISTFLVTWALGFSINMMTLMALALSIGILVDDSIVVLENIHRHLTLGESPLIAALKGRSEIGLAAIAITLCDVVVYLPVAFMQGNVGKLLKEYGLTVATVTLFSLFISFTLTPMLASRWLRHEGEAGGRRGWWSRFTAAWERGFDHLGRAYRRVLHVALHCRPLVVLLGAAALAAALAFIPLRLVGTEYAPSEASGQFTVSVQLPPGTNLQTTDAAVRQIEALLRNVPEVSGVFTSVGVGGGYGTTGSNQARLTVGLVDRSQRSHSVFDVIAALRPQTARLGNVSVQYTVDNPLAGGGGAALTIRLAGEDLTTLQQLAGQVEATARTVPGIADVRNNANTSLPEVRAVVDPARMADLGITTQQVATAVRTSIGGTVVTTFQPAGKTGIDVTVIADDANRLNLDTLANLPLRTAGGQMIRLGQVARFESGTSPSQIQRQDRQTIVTLSASVVGRPLGDVVRDFRAAMAPTPVPPGYSYTLTGQAQQLDQALAALLSALALSVLLIYMLLVALYESWLEPLAILFALPVALVGAFLGLFVTGNTFNLFSMIGMVMLMGIVAKNAILLVDYTNTLRARGRGRLEALLEAGQTRLRPIVMTTATIVCAMIPLALKFEAGAESRAPLAVVVLGGVISSTLLTLVLVPVMYTYFDDLQALLRNLRAPRWRQSAPAPLAIRADEAGHAADD